MTFDQFKIVLAVPKREHMTWTAHDLDIAQSAVGTAVTFGALLGGVLGHVWLQFWSDAPAGAFALVGTRPRCWRRRRKV